MNLFEIMTGPVSRMSHVTRYSSYPVHRKENVAEHSWWVTFIALLITEDLQRQAFDVNMRVVLTRALTHDLDECLSGDIIRTFKYANDQILEAIKETADANMDELCQSMGDVGWLLRSSWEDAKDDTIEGHIVSFSDMATVALYCREEYRSGNQAGMAVLRESYENWFCNYHDHNPLGQYIEQMFPNRVYSDMLIDRGFSRMVPPGQLSLEHSEGATTPHEWESHE